VKLLVDNNEVFGHTTNYLTTCCQLSGTLRLVVRKKRINGVFVAFLSYIMRPV